MNTVLRSAILPGFVRTTPASQHSTRIQMDEIDGQLSSLVSQLNPQRDRLNTLRDEHEALWKEQRKTKSPSSELNERMAEILADMTEIHRKMQPLVETIELKRDEYNRLQNQLLGK